MNIKLIFAIIVFIASNLNAQIGIGAFIQKNDYDNWNQIIQSSAEQSMTDIFDQSYEFSLDYWFRLKNVRLEFYPGISLQYSTSSQMSSSNGLIPSSYRLGAISTGINSHIYILDFKNDCNCPTFSKQNDLIKKGAFLLIGARANFQSKRTNYASMHNMDYDISLQILLGLGLDIGISDLFTISPIISISYTPTTEWSGISNNHGIIHITPPDESSSNLGFRLGIRMGFRPDYVRNNR